jgi:hypothetical protein
VTDSIQPETALDRARARVDTDDVAWMINFASSLTHVLTAEGTATPLAALMYERTRKGREHTATPWNLLSPQNQAYWLETALSALTLLAEMAETGE